MRIDGRGLGTAVMLCIAVVSSGACTAVGQPAADGSQTTAADLEPDLGVARRAAHTATTTTEGQALVVGGCVVDGCGLASDESFLITDTAVTRTGPLNQARDAHTATLIPDGRVLVAGGFGREGSPPLATVELFDPASRTWSFAGGLQTARGGHAATRLGDSGIVVVGGWVGPRRYTDTTEIFDPAAGSFRPGPRLPVAVDGAAAATLADGSALVVGGQSSPSVATATAVLISPAGTVIVVGSMRHARFKHAAVTLTDGRILVLGGTPDDVTLLASTEIYDPSTQEFTDGPVMRTGRYKLAGGVALTSAGEVIIAGGGSGAEVLNIAAGTTRPLDTVPAVRLSFSTVSVLGRSVRVLGGYDEAIRLTGTDVTVQLT